MEKLEKILRAEDDARATVADARTEAQRIVSEARAAAALILRDGRATMKADAAVRRDAVLAQARADAAALEAAGVESARAVLDGARSRTDAAVAAVLSVLKGR
jgi:vacuolar-type H+-ATPase subunit H